MKRLLFAAATLGMAAFTGSASAQQTVRIATEGAYAPYNFINEAGQPAGFEIDLGNEICLRAELACEFVVTAWDSMIPNLLAGNYDLIMAGMSITEERLQTIDFTEDYYPPDPAVFVIRTGTAFDFDALAGVRLGAQTATIQAGYLQDTLATGNTVVLFDTFEGAVNDLLAGNLDIVMIDGGFVAPIIETTGGALVLAGPEVTLGGGVGAGVRKEDTELRDTFTRIIAEMKADGSLNALIAEWFDDPILF
ncbi:MAG: transporter substrate-binding domain-containing protein [Bauldia sp.]|nr:transporter substrate-binding domain-containing protein [Bauldia sp.]